jgi:hypothetical protein
MSIMRGYHFHHEDIQAAWPFMELRVFVLEGQELFCDTGT